MQPDGRIFRASPLYACCSTSRRSFHKSHSLLEESARSFMIFGSCRYGQERFRRSPAPSLMTCSRAGTRDPVGLMRIKVFGLFASLAAIGATLGLDARAEVPLWL